MRKNVLGHENREKLGSAVMARGEFHNDGEHNIDFKKGQIMTASIENNWADCVCDALADCCGALSPCAIPGLLEAIENHQWSKAAYLIIQAGECTLEIEVIVPVLAFASVACLFADAGFDLHPAQQDILDKEIERVKPVTLPPYRG